MTTMIVRLELAVTKRQDLKANLFFDSESCG